MSYDYEKVLAQQEIGRQLSRIADAMERAEQDKTKPTREYRVTP